MQTTNVVSSSQIVSLAMGYELDNDIFDHILDF
jgi:hypothetical protein